MKIRYVRYYFCSKNPSFREIYPRGERGMSLSVTNNAKAKRFASYMASEGNIQDYWVEKRVELIEKVKTVIFKSVCPKSKKKVSK